jgi:hypothetical protein
MDWNDLAEATERWWALVNKPKGSIKSRKFLD